MITSKNDGSQADQYVSKVMEATGGPAFPVKREFFDGSFFHFNGLTARDWFAGMALGHLIEVFDRYIPDNATPENFATEAYAIADAMLKERAKARGEQP